MQPLNLLLVALLFKEDLVDLGSQLVILLLHHPIHVVHVFRLCVCALLVRGEVVIRKVSLQQTNRLHELVITLLKGCIKLVVFAHLLRLSVHLLDLVLQVCAALAQLAEVVALVVNLPFRPEGAGLHSRETMHRHWPVTHLHLCVRAHPDCLPLRSRSSHGCALPRVEPRRRSRRDASHGGALPRRRSRRDTSARPPRRRQATHRAQASRHGSASLRHAFRSGPCQVLVQTPEARPWSRRGCCGLGPFSLP
mmetsp:Transcript_134784/g.340828  ORF Transcript_134784/g.340828 Transcript_134784/m.340828 type:complete len:251 (+) Transcript_134784:1249-2001(+)